MAGLRFYDAFAGMGVFRMGMEQAGHTYVGSCEIDSHARKAYAAIHGAPPTHSDIRQVNPDELPDFDVLCGGFPCQAFSRAGHQRGFEDTRGTLFFELLRIAQAKAPHYLLFENVGALLSHGRWQTFETILRSLDDLGYDAEWQRLNSKHFGVPQNRERVFLVGHSRKSRTRGVFPIIGETDGTLVCVRSDRRQWKRIYDGDGIATTLQSTMGNIGEATLYTVRDRQGGEVVPQDGQAVVIDRYYDDHALRLVGDYALAIDANYWKGLDGRGQRTAVIDGMRVRRLTPREAFRLQGVPDEYFDRAAGAVSKTQLYKLAGNAVSLPVVYEIAKRLEVAV